jgi:hypothetical protein
MTYAVEEAMFQAIKHSDLEIVITKAFAVPPEQVFKP